MRKIEDRVENKCSFTAKTSTHGGVQHTAYRGSRQPCCKGFTVKHLSPFAPTEQLGLDPTDFQRHV